MNNQEQVNQKQDHAKNIQTRIEDLKVQAETAVGDAKQKYTDEIKKLEQEKQTVLDDISKLKAGISDLGTKAKGMMDKLHW